MSEQDVQVGPVTKVARDLTEGRVKPPWPEDRWPTAEEWATWFVSNPPAERTVIAERMLAASQEAQRCIVANHEAAIEELNRRRMGLM